MNRFGGGQPPRRLRTAYAYYVRDQYHEVARTLETSRPQTIISRLGAAWRQLSPAERQPYIELEQRDRARYEQARAEWVRMSAGRPLGYMNKRRKDPFGPRRPASAYILYKRDMAERIRTEMPNATARERDREIIRRWRQLDEVERERYKDKARDDRMRYAQELYGKRVGQVGGAILEGIDVQPVPALQAPGAQQAPAVNPAPAAEEPWPVVNLAPAAQPQQPAVPAAAPGPQAAPVPANPAPAVQPQQPVVPAAAPGPQAPIIPVNPAPAAQPAAPAPAVVI